MQLVDTSSNPVLGDFLGVCQKRLIRMEKILRKEKGLHSPYIEEGYRLRGRLYYVTLIVSM